MRKNIVFALVLIMFFIPISCFAWTDIGIYAPVYRGNSSHVCNDSGYYSYDPYGTSVNGQIYWELGQKNIDNSQFAYNIFMAFKYDLPAQTFYDVKITFNGSDARKAINSSRITLYSGSNCTTLTSNQTDISLISFTNKATSDTYATSITLRVYTSALVGDWGIAIDGVNTKLTSQNWGISNVSFRSVDMSGNKEIIESNTNNTNNIINNNNSNTEEIINNNTQNTQDIINNNNTNTQDIINSNKSCIILNQNDAIVKGKYLSSNGNLTNDNNYGVTDYININNSDIKVLSAKTDIANMCFYDINKNFISCVINNSMSDNQMLQIPTSSIYARFSLKDNKPTYQICKGGNQALTDTFTDDSIPTGNDYFDDFNDMLPSNNTISSLITLPLSLYTKVLNSINGTCSPITLGNLYNTNLVMPCINLETYLGSTLFGVIDLIMSGGFILIISKKMVKAFHNFTSMKEGDVINND